MSFFWVGNFEFFFQKKIFFASSPWKLVTNFVLELMGLNFHYCNGLEPEMRAGIINEKKRKNEHECLFGPKICLLHKMTLFYLTFMIDKFTLSASK